MIDNEACTLFLNDSFEDRTELVSSIARKIVEEDLAGSAGMALEDLADEDLVDIHDIQEQGPTYVAGYIATRILGKGKSAWKCESCISSMNAVELEPRHTFTVEKDVCPENPRLCRPSVGMAKTVESCMLSFERSMEGKLHLPDLKSVAYNQVLLMADMTWLQCDELEHFEEMSKRFLTLLTKMLIRALCRDVSEKFRQEEVQKKAREAEKSEAQKARQEARAAAAARAQQLREAAKQRQAAKIEAAKQRVAEKREAAKRKKALAEAERQRKKAEADAEKQRVKEDKRKRKAEAIDEKKRKKEAASAKRFCRPLEGQVLFALGPAKAQQLLRDWE